MSFGPEHLNRESTPAPYGRGPDLAEARIVDDLNHIVVVLHGNVRVGVQEGPQRVQVVL